MIESHWRKSSFSGNQGNCVEVASALDQVRDSKNPTRHLHTPLLRGLVDVVKNNHFTR